MSPHSLIRVRLCSGFPRVSGDEPLAEVTAGKKISFSPRERG